MTPSDERPTGSQSTAALLRRGEYALMLTAAGGGGSSFRGFALTRWTADRTRDADGFFVYLRDSDTGDAWSAGHQPMGRAADAYEARLAGGRAEIVRRDGEIETRLEVRLPMEGDAELRRITLTNHGDRPRRIEVTTCAELVLNTPGGDAAHPAFSKLFVQTGWMADHEALVAWRRLRSPDDEPLWVVHRLLGDGGEPEYETDRSRFIGRGRTLASPAAMDAGARLSGTVGNVLDPVFSLRRVVTLRPGESATLVAILGAGRAQQDVETIAGRYADLAAAQAAFDSAPAADAGDEKALGVPESWLANAGRLSTPRAVLPLSPRSLRGEGAGGWGTLDGGDPLGWSSEPLQFFNGFGGFSQDGREYVIRMPAGEHGPVRPPLPWTNVIANEHTGFLVSESGAASTWTANSRENRLTPWSNDPVSDPHGEALYLRDDDDGVSWSPTAGPAPEDGVYEARHGFGYSRFRHAGNSLDQETTMFVPRHDPVKIVRLRLTNTGDRPRRISAFSYAQLVLGGLSQETGAHVETRYDAAADAILATNANRGEFSQRVAFAAAVLPASEERHDAVQPPPGVFGGGASLGERWGRFSWTADRTAFLGPYGSAASPEALAAERLDGAAGAGLDPCFALQVPLLVAPGQTAEVAFLLGEAADEAAARALVAKYRAPGAVGAALQEVRAFWDDIVGGVQVRTPSPELDLMVNGWLTYQGLSCRVWGRTAFYQSGGAFGFRDQLQDSSAFVYLRPELTRRQILLHASHQFVEGDVLHWWHPPLSKGIRTRFADDLLWLPYITCFYVSSTGDAGVLDESAPFVTAEHLSPGEDEVFLFPGDSGRRASVYEHCCRSIDRSLTRGAHGLPLMGTGDWNDGMNRVGREGRGESVWLGFFLHGILDDFIPLCEARGDGERAERYRAYRATLAEALNARDQGWDGEWYRRAYYDNGAPLGSAANDECRIDAIAQAWAVLSGVAPAERAEQALDALERHLVSERDGIIRLLTPAFDRTPHDPGYIKGYLPGVRENGGQYTHAALWAVRALAQAGRTERAARLLEMVSPVSHGRTADEVAVYQGEPYVIAADVYGVAPHVGRGGWTWYTGSAGWMFRVALESVLGITLGGGDALCIRPCVPRDWPGFTVRYRLPGGATTYEIAATREDGGGIRGSADGQDLEVADGVLRVPLARDGGTHRVDVVLGRDFAPAYVPNEPEPAIRAE
jgi:N,N'-diacetylchitobiose phosphorylase